MSKYNNQYYAAYSSVTSGFTWQNLCNRAKWKLTGGDRVRWLNGQVTNDVRTLEPNHTMYAAVTNARGKMEGDIWIHATGDALWIDADPLLADSLRTRFEKYIIADDVMLEDVSSQWLIYHALSMVERKLSPLDAKWIRSRRFNESGWDVWIPRASVDAETYRVNLEIEERMWEVLRVEDSVPKWGIEMDSNTLPPEVGLDQTAVSYTKGCYIGQEVLARIHSIGRVNRKLCKLEAIDRIDKGVQKQIVPHLSETCFVGDKEVGKITSAAFSIKHENPIGRQLSPDDAWWTQHQKLIALGIIHRQYASLGAELRSASADWKIVKII